MAAKQVIPEKIKKQADEIVHRFNKNKIKSPYYFYTTRYRGQYLYLGRQEGDRFSPICRLKYTGDIDNWEFAIYKYSRDRYDPDEWFFPGSGYVDGTIVGALKAGLEAYP